MEKQYATAVLHIPPVDAPGGRQLQDAYLKHGCAQPNLLKLPLAARHTGAKGAVLNFRGPREWPLPRALLPYPATA